MISNRFLLSHWVYILEKLLH